MIRFAILGAGWRSEFYLRVAKLVPQKFEVSGIYIRNADKRRLFKQKYSVCIFDNLDDLLETDFDFVVSCVDKNSICDTIRQLTKRGAAVLSETPVTDNTLCGKVQVAEQFHFMPRNQAYKSIIKSGILGNVHQVQLSCCHDYHAASLIRFFLDTGDEFPTRHSFNLPDAVIRYNSRGGLLPQPQTVYSDEKHIIFYFKEKTAIYDFSFEQYFSDIRGSRILIKGTNGEISNDRCTYLKNGFSHSFEIKRNSYGANESLDGLSLLNITGEGKILYENPFRYARLSDEEIAIATCLENMKEYLVTGKSFYSPQSASIDSKMFL